MRTYPVLSRFILVTGLPASGKSTLGRAVAAALGLPLLDKDEILEALFESRGVGDSEWRRKLSRFADEELRTKAFQLEGAVLTSWWRHPRSHVESGTPVDWLASLPGNLIELHCVCSPRIAAERFLARRRHEGHLDLYKSFSEILASFEEQSLLGPLRLGRLVEACTEGQLDISAIVREIGLTNG
jgi:hypothetical protein